MKCPHCGKEVVEGLTTCPHCAKEVSVAAPAQASGFFPATWQKRFINTVIDNVALFIVGGILGVLIGDYSNILALFISVAFFAIFEVLTQKTPGKYLTKTKVVSREGTKPAFGNIIGRSFARLIPFDALSFIYVHPIGWHDSLSATLVVPDSYRCHCSYWYPRNFSDSGSWRCPAEVP
jgi:uncharacterized RDD family membrane protein YckC